MSSDDLTTPEAVRAVIDTPDPAVRNLRITQSYHELSLAYDELFGGGDAPWTSFATWASKQAGRFIRNEEVPRHLRRFLGLDVRRRLPWWSPGRLLRHGRFLGYVRCTVEDVSAHATEGNRLVYTRLAPVFADFLTLARGLDRPDPARLGELLDAVTARDPSLDEKVRRAFTHYHAALFERDAKARAELVFAANALVGWHEQIRLQEAIDGALAAPIRRALDDPERRWTSWSVPMALRRFGAAVFRTVLAPVIRGFEDEWKVVATRCLMTLALPGGALELGDDLPPLADGEMFPAVLRDIASPEGRALVAELDDTPHTTRGSGACDWTDLGDRMNYIVDFFRSRHQDSDLLAAPFTAEQAAAIRAGRLPSGRL